MSRGADFVAYIDESGDEGFKFFPDGSGSSRWFVMGAVVVRATNDRGLVAERDAIVQKIHAPRRDIHFRDLNHSKRVVVVQDLARLPLRAIAVMWKKDDEATLRSSMVGKKGKLYRYATRLLLERIQSVCLLNRKVGGVACRTVFSNRANMSYADLRSYVSLLVNGSHALRADVFDPSGIEAVDHAKLAGLQFADVVASSFFFRLTRDRFGISEPRYSEELRPIVHAVNGRAEGHGLKAMPSGSASFDK